jgi:RNA polymerase sigma factor (sigma-70 family)
MDGRGNGTLERSDGDLLASGGPAEFGEVYDRHAHAVLGYLYRRTADPETAADLTAETFAAAYLSRGGFREMGSGARGWLIGIAQHQLSRLIRRQRVEDRARRRLGLERIPVDELSYERIEDLVDFRPLRDAVREAMAELSPAVREAVSLRVGQELSYGEVARRLGCSEVAARVRVARGLTRLTELMEVTR